MTELIKCRKCNASNSPSAETCVKCGARLKFRLFGAKSKQSALEICKACGEQVSSAADTCPKCGHPVGKERKARQTAQGLAGCFAFLIIMGFLAYKGCDRAIENSSEPRIVTREDKVKALFSGWDGSHKTLVQFMKSQVNDADLFEHVQTTYHDYGDRIFVKMTFRASNAFGAKVINIVVADSDLEGNLTNIRMLE